MFEYNIDFASEQVRASRRGVPRYPPWHGMNSQLGLLSNSKGDQPQTLLNGQPPDFPDNFLLRLAQYPQYRRTPILSFEVKGLVKTEYKLVEYLQ